MRIVSLLVAMCFTLNVMASTGSLQEFERILDDYHYDLIVEWDQKDPDFYETKTKVFFKNLQRLIEEEGLSQEEINSIISRKVSNKKIIEALKLKMSLMKGATSEDLTQMIKSSVGDMYREGASWNGYVVIPVAFGLLIAAAVGYAIWWVTNHECVENELMYVCTTPSSSYCNYPSSVYKPCYNAPNSYCRYTEVCTRYEEK